MGEKKEFLAIKAGKLIDGTGKRPLENALIVIDGSKIVEVGSEREVQIPIGSKILDASRRTVMPGLMDMHVHLGQKQKLPLGPWWSVSLTPINLRMLYAVKDLKDYIEAGFTTIRNMAPKEFIHLKKAVELELFPGPRIVHGSFVCMTAGHVSRLPESLADGVDEVRKRVRQHIANGADFIKTSTSGGAAGELEELIWRNYTMGELEALIDETHGLGKRASTHACSTEGIKNAVKAGFDSVEHGTFIDDEVAEMMAKSGVIYVPTISVYGPPGYLHPDKTWAPEWGRRKAEYIHPKHVASFQKAYRAGVKIAMGTDTGILLDHGDNTGELELYVTYGMSPMEAIVTATSNGAEAAGLGDKTGTIEAKKLADIIVVDGDPSKDISVLRRKENIRIVIKEGKVMVNRGI